ncbi:HNH endonuclease signature motif containing protein [Streptomyces subrutilus]|uniref:HNH endonuclease signature motif containing protein n=1 Tax=Streptomyces subrutilus TaxID=36818 RepID=UPI00099F4BB5|nr:HNH endonuclease signature motif containing protein [Streptomyces subrutilus]
MSFEIGPRITTNLLAPAPWYMTRCMIWPWHKVNGYGYILVAGKGHRVHRFMYELVNGPIPEGLVLDHLCRRPACFNPEHLEAVTQKENVRRGNAGKNSSDKTHCPQGHPYAGDNLYRKPSGGRVCRTCTNDQKRSGIGAGGINARKTHCPQGHLYDEANTIRDKRGHRKCRTCKTLRDRARRSVLEEG